MTILLVVLALWVGSGIADSHGFVHASRMWREGTLVWREWLWSAIGFTLGSAMYWLSLRYTGRLGIVSAEAQVMVWFAVTIVGVAVVSGKFGEWPLVDRLVALVVASGLGWLMVRADAV
jgi:hypothetical protein